MSKGKEEFRGDQKKERRILKKQMEMKKKEEREKEEKKKEDLLNDCKFSKKKLRKLVIIKFDVIHIDWFRFWNQLESQIDKCDLPQLSKFS